jgi:hypothetical protein
VPPAVAPTTVLIGGSFTGVGGTSIRRLAAVDLTSGAATSFNANPDSVVNKVLVDGTTAYIGGFFQSVGGTQRNFIAAVDATSGALGSWYPAGGADGFVQTLAADASSIYVGGSFFTVGGQSRANLAKIAKAGSAVAAWHPDPDEIVYGITPSGSTVYVSGNFAHLAGVARNFTGAVDATSGAALAFNPNPDFVVLNVTVPPTPPNTVYLSGAFLNVGGTQTGTAAAVNATSGALLPWFPLTNDTVNDLLPDATRVMVGGVFVTAGATPRLSLAAFTNAGVPDPPTSVTATAGNASATVTFTPPVNTGGSAVTGYTVTSSPAGGVDANAGSTSTSHMVNSLTNGVTYTFTVKATTALGTSGPSAPSNAVTPSAGGATAPTLSGAVSRKVHGAAGTFDLPLSAVATNPTTEPRQGPAQTIVFTFNKAIASATAAVTEGVATAGTPSFSGNNVIVGLTGVADQHYVTISLTNVASTDGGSGGSGSVRVGFLVGDVNQNRVVAISDLALVNAQLAQPVTAANFLKDVNASGTLSLADKAITNANLTKSLAAP